MIDIDVWQVIGSVAAAAFTIGFIDQVRMTYQTKCVEGLSLVQWVIFTLASTLFVMYYIHLNQWLMAAVSIFGAICCLSIVVMYFWYRKKHINL